MMIIKHKFLKEIPGDLEDGIIYISMDYATAIHKCFCGCGNEVITPLTKTGWKLTFNGKTVSLYPSIGNWSFPCQSHYWITNDEVRWVPKWTKEEIAKGRQDEKLYSERYYENISNSEPSIFNFWKKFLRFFSPTVFERGRRPSNRK